MPTYLFFDESGDFSFNSSASHYYYFGALLTQDPGPLTLALTNLRYELLDGGLELDRFHCSEDRQSVRDRVFEAIGRVPDLSYYSLVINKRCVSPAQYDPAIFYPTFAQYLLGKILYKQEGESERLVIITDRLPIKRGREAVEKAFKTFIKRHLGSRPFSIVHHASHAHPGLQAADYCTWAIQKRWEKGDMRSYALIQNILQEEFLIFRYDTRKYY